jgi:hydrogenase maturation protease
MKEDTIPCLILACGNTLREDDGVGPWLAAWAAERFTDDVRVWVLARQQWTPELAEYVARAEAVIFVDSAVDSPGRDPISLRSIEAASSSHAMHHFDSGELLTLAHDCYGAQPRKALLLTVSAHSMELREGLSKEVLTRLPAACKLLETTVANILELASAEYKAV